MSQALYREFRPHHWEEVIGQDHVIRTLQNAIRSGRVGHAYLFAGPRGTGKTTTARLLAKAINCLHDDPDQRPCDACANCLAVNENRFLDLIEIDAASNTSVDDVRDLRDKINFSPTQGKMKVYIIDEVHMLSTAAFNALLKTLEEPPAHAMFILATTEVHKIPATVLSRCQRHEFRRIPVKDIVTQLDKIVAAHSLTVEPEALTLIARQSTGCMRDAISLLDQLASGGERVTLTLAQTVMGTAASQTVIDLAEAMLQKDPAKGLTCIRQSLDNGTDSRQFARQVVEYLRNLLLFRMGSADQVDASPELRAQLARQAQQLELPRLIEAIRLFNNAATDARSGWQPSLALELALASSLQQPAVQAAPPPAQTAQTPVYQPPVSAPPPQQQQNSGQSAPPPQQPHESPVTSVSAGQVAPPALTQTASAQDASSVFTRVTQNWTRIVAAVKKQRPATAAVLNSCRPLTMKENALVLGFDSEIVKSKLETPENLDLTRQTIAAVIGTELAIVCVVSKKGASSAPDLDIDRDGMVGTALGLGGKIVHKE